MSPRVEWDAITRRLLELQDRPRPVILAEPGAITHAPMLAALSCSYCGRALIVDFMRWNGECPWCGGYATIDEIAGALSLSAVLVSGPPKAHDGTYFAPHLASYPGITGSMQMTDQFAVLPSGSHPDARLLLLHNWRMD